MTQKKIQISQIEGISGTNTGDQTITLTGGVTGSGSGSFATTVVTNANLTGMVTSVGNATTVVTNANLTGDVTSVGNATTLSNTAVTPGSYTSSNITVDAKGRITAANSGGGAGTSYTLQPVVAATTVGGTLATAFANGSVVDGITLATGNRILIKNQGVNTENGIYTVNASGAPTRATDFNTGSSTLTPGVQVFVLGGTANIDTNWQFQPNVTSITIGTTPILWVPFAGTTSNGAVVLGKGSSSYNYGVVIGNNSSSSTYGHISIGGGISNTGNAGASIYIGTVSGNGPQTVGVSGSSNIALVAGGGLSGGGFDNIQSNNNIYIYNAAIFAATSVSAKSFGMQSVNQSNNKIISNGPVLVVNGYQTVWSTGSIANGGDSQISKYNIRRQGTSATAVVLTSDGLTPNTGFPSTNQIGIFTGQVVAFRAIVVGKNTSTTDSAGWEVKGLVSNVGGTVAIIGTPTVTLLGASAGAITQTWGVVGKVTVAVSTNFLQFSCVGAAATTINWNAVVETSEVM